MPKNDSPINVDTIPAINYWAEYYDPESKSYSYDRILCFCVETYLDVAGETFESVKPIAIDQDGISHEINVTGKLENKWSCTRMFYSASDLDGVVREMPFEI